MEKLVDTINRELTKAERENQVVITKEQVQLWFNEALREWLNSLVRSFGIWSLRTIVGFMVYLLVKLMFYVNAHQGLKSLLLGMIRHGVGGPHA